MVLVRKSKKWRHMKQSHCLYFSWSTSPWLSLNVAYFLISSRLSMEIFLGRKAARKAPWELPLRFTPYSMGEQFQGSGMLWTCWWHLWRSQLMGGGRWRELKLQQASQVWRSQKGTDTATSIQRWRLMLRLWRCISREEGSKMIN